MPTYQYLNDKQEVIAEVRAYDINDAHILFHGKYELKYGNPYEFQWKIKPKSEEDCKILGNVVQSVLSLKTDKDGKIRTLYGLKTPEELGEMIIDAVEARKLLDG